MGCHFSKWMAQQYYMNYMQMGVIVKPIYRRGFGFHQKMNPDGKEKREAVAFLEDGLPLVEQSLRGEMDQLLDGRKIQFAEQRQLVQDFDDHVFARVHDFIVA